MNSESYKRYMNDYDIVSEAQLKSAIKRINDRLYQLDKAGLRESTAWKYYENFANAFGGIKMGKRPHITISKTAMKNLTTPVTKVTRRDLETGEVLATKQVNSSMAKDILHADRYGGTLGSVKKSAKDYLKQKGNDDPTDEEMKKAVNTLSNVHEFIENNQDKIYAVEDATKEFIRGNNGRLTAEEVDRLMNINEEYNKLMSEDEDEDEDDTTPSDASNLYEDINPFEW